MSFRILISALVLTSVSGCGPSYSPDTYASNAAQQANKVEQGVVVGVRNVAVSAAGTVGTVTGGAAGGIAGSQVAAGPVSAFTALGGALVGGIAGSTAEHMTGDTTAFEYIVRKPNGDLVSVTQKDKTPLVLGQKVLVIVGTQARVVPDYTVPPLAPKTADLPKSDTAAKPSDGKQTGSQPPQGVADQPGATGTVPGEPRDANESKASGTAPGDPMVPDAKTAVVPPIDQQAPASAIPPSAIAPPANPAGQSDTAPAATPDSPAKPADGAAR